jgi:uncharacterized protein (TIGR02466 family)
VKIENIFTNFLIEETLDIDNGKIERFCLQERERDIKGHIISNVGGWQGHRFNYFSTDLQDIYHTVDDRFKYLTKHFNFKDVERNISNCWININSKNSFHVRHPHPYCLFAAVYYVKVPNNSGSIVLHNPQINYTMYISPHMVDSYNTFNSTTYTINPTEGKLIIFPAWLEHEVLPSNTDEERISISFNSHGPNY